MVILRDTIRANRELAINMLATVANRSQSLISQFEQLTLKSVTERVGWFLLNLSHNGGENALRFTLPYDKGLIASYLGMKPETFSRALQQLKDNGIRVERNVVTLPDHFALCEFCDLEIAGKCKNGRYAAMP